MGRQDEALVDDVGYALLARIQDCLTVTEAHQGRVTCPRCRTIIQRQFGHHERQPDEIISCLECGWSITWDEFHRSYRNKHLGSAGLAIIFCEFAEHFPRAQSYQEKIVLIDRVLHRYHWELEGEPGGPSAVNLIGGTRWEVLAFLNRLTYGEQGTPGLSETKQRWLEQLHYGGWRRDTIDELSAQYPAVVDDAESSR